MARLGLVLALLCLYAISAHSAPSLVAAQFAGSARLGVAHVDVLDFHLERQSDAPPRHQELFTAAEIAARYARARELGVGWHRWSLNWDLVIQGGNYDFTAADGIVERDLAAGLRTLAVLHGVPPGEKYYLASPPSLAYPIFKQADGSLTDDPAQAAAVNGGNLWADYVAHVVRRYKPGGELARARGWGAGVGVRAWEMGNEPNLKGFWPGTAADFVRFLEVSYLVAKWLDPGATVVHGGIADHGNSSWWYGQFADALKARAAASPLPARYNYYFDKTAWHWYQPVATLITPPAKARAILQERGLPVKPVWVTETGLAIWNEYPGPCWSGPSPGRGTLDEQATFVHGILGELGRSGVELMIFFQLFDDCGNGPASYDAFGLVRNPMGHDCFTPPGQACWSPDPATAGQPRPAFFVLQSAARGTARGGPARTGPGPGPGLDAPDDRAGDPGFGGGPPARLDTAPPAEVLVAAPAVAEARFTVQIMAGDPSGLLAYQLYFARGAPPTGAGMWQAAGPPQPWPEEPTSGLVAVPFEAQAGETYYFAAQAADRLGHWSALPPQPMAATRTSALVVRRDSWDADRWPGSNDVSNGPTSGERNDPAGTASGGRGAGPAADGAGPSRGGAGTDDGRGALGRRAGARPPRGPGWLPRGWLRNHVED